MKKKALVRKTASPGEKSDLNFSTGQPERDAQPVDFENAPRLPFPVVGIGASAGGLTAVTEFLAEVNRNSGMAYVFIQHLPPSGESMLTEILATRSHIPVKHIEENEPVEACVASFSKSMAKQLAEKGIRVNAVAPGPFWTPLQPSGGATMEKVRSFGSETPMARPGQPAEIAPTYVLLAMKDSSYITGELFGNTGGLSPL